MQDNLFDRQHRRHQQDLNIVPILDMMVTVIFFLLLSSSFIELTKITVPPSGTVTIDSPVVPPPMQPKLYVMEKKDSFLLRLIWSGKDPGQLQETVKKDPALLADEEKSFDQIRTDLLKTAKKITDDFKTKFPTDTEKTLQIGMGGQVGYQYMISVMDGIQKNMPDVVLISDAETDAEQVRSGESDK